MSTEKEEYISENEIKKEFQVERMILFSDAVFAIVITLMAIDIKITEVQEKLDQETLIKELIHLLPTIFSYIVSFFFIGSTWYQHLKLFSFVKDYDRGLVVRNLFLLFLIGLFPFSASVITRSHGAPLAFFIYLGIILLCVYSQYSILYYLINKRANLRVSLNMEEQRFELKKRKIILIAFSIAFVMCFISYYLITDPDLRAIIPLWLIPVPIAYRLFVGKKPK